MRLVYMGTPDFAAAPLAALSDAGHSIEAVVCQPDRPAGRGKAVKPGPVKETAIKLGLKVLQPEKIKNNEEFLGQLRAIAPDAVVVAAYGKILPRQILELPEYGCVNIHASLLPKYRGAAPVQWAVVNGEKESGLTTMLMDEGLDTGDILMQRVVPLAADETGGSLFGKLQKAAGPIIIETLAGLEAGTITPIPQQGASCYASMLTKEMGQIDWRRDAASIERLVRGLDPWPSAFTFIDGRMVKILKSRTAAAGDDACMPCGMVAAVGRQSFCVMTGSGLLEVLEVQPAGKKRMDTGAFLRGNHIERGMVLGRKDD